MKETPPEPYFDEKAEKDSVQDEDDKLDKENEGLSDKEIRAKKFG